MSELQEHDCEESAVEYKSTPEKPYHYVGSGLKNAYLVGVKYWVCSVCGKQSAEIPSLHALLPSIARTIVEKKSPLIGEQVRFLRKRLARQSKEFAALIGVTPERYSAIEASEVPLAEGRDKLVRFVYRALSHDRKLKDALANEQQIEKWLVALHGRGDSECIVATWLRTRKWKVEAAPMELCAA
jgi:transcriptional regulator with XRE-family HTH domain